MILINFHSSEHTEILTLCDSDLIGKKLFNITISNAFYGSSEYNEKYSKALKEAKNINALGKQSINLLLKNKIIKQKDVKYYDNIPHVQVLSL